MKKDFNEEAQYIGYEDGVRLYNAALSGDDEILAAILDKYPNADINQPVGPLYVNPTLLEAAASGGHKGTVELLLKRGANVNQPNITLYGGPLTRAVANGHIEIVRLLLDNHANINGYGPRTSLIAAIDTLQPTMVHLLLERGADVNVKAPNGSTIIQRLNESISRKLSNGFGADERQDIDDTQLLARGTEIAYQIEEKIGQQKNIPKTSPQKNTP